MNGDDQSAVMVSELSARARVSTSNGREALDVFATYYDALRTFAQNGTRLPKETRALCAELTAEFAVSHHPGRFADGAIENVLLEIGSDLDGLDLPGLSWQELPIAPETEATSRRRVLHIASSVFPIGGHTRTIGNWINLDSESRHSVLLTQQKASVIPAWLTSAVAASGGELVALPNELSVLAKALWLRRYAHAMADLVILHHWGCDAVPMVAFATDGGPPICVLNQADHLFWLGSSVADAVINQREAGAIFSGLRRFSLHNEVLPIPLTDRPRIDRRDARTALGIATDQIMLLSIGRGEKFRPAGRHNFFRTMQAVLDNVQKAHLYVVGLSESEAAEFGCDLHRRIHLCGSIDDPSIYQAASDLYLEGFPIGSPTALLETAMAGIPVTLPYAPLLNLLVTNHGIERIVPYAADESEYVEQVSSLAQDQSALSALGESLREHVRARHTGDRWRALLRQVYARVGELRHRPREIPVESCNTSEDDRTLAGLHAAANDRAAGQRTPIRAVRRLLFDAAHGARQSGDYAGSLAILKRCMRLCGQDAGLLVAIGKLPLHYVWRRLRSMR